MFKISATYDNFKVQGFPGLGETHKNKQKFVLIML